VKRAWVEGKVDEWRRRDEAAYHDPRVIEGKQVYGSVTIGGQRFADGGMRFAEGYYVRLEGNEIVKILSIWKDATTAVGMASVRSFGTTGGEIVQTDRVATIKIARLCSRVIIVESFVRLRGILAGWYAADRAADQAVQVGDRFNMADDRKLVQVWTRDYSFATKRFVEKGTMAESGTYSLERAAKPAKPAKRSREPTEPTRRSKRLRDGPPPLEPVPVVEEWPVPDPEHTENMMF
jgi:hypothetical protein